MRWNRVHFLSRGHARLIQGLNRCGQRTILSRHFQSVPSIVVFPFGGSGYIPGISYFEGDMGSNAVTSDE